MASAYPVSCAFAKWLLSMTLPNESVCSKSHRCTTHAPSCAKCIAQNMPIDSIKPQCFLTTCQSAYLKITNGESLFDSNDSNANALADHAKESWIPVPSSIILVESKVKGTYFCTSTGKHESSVSKFSTAFSVLAPKGAATTKDVEVLRNRKRRNENNRYHARRSACNAEVLAEARSL